ncbi:MAG: hypothetical protein ABIR06_02050 [Cyclobacteriaceae bacterium]
MLPYKIYTRKKIFNYYTGLSFFIFIWITRQPSDETQLVRHEKIHFWQQVEMLFVFHWILYALFYLLGRMKGQCHYIAYRYNPFELEAFANDPDASYLEKRRAFAWAGFLRQFYQSLEMDHSQNVPPGKKIIWYRSPRQ